MTFADRIRAARAAAGISRSQLARLLEAPEQNVKNWETGRSKPSFKYIVKLQEVFPGLDMGRYLDSMRELVAS